MKRRAFPWHLGFIRVTSILVLALLCGCTVARVGKAGLSLGASAVKSTAKVGGAAVGLAGSAIGIGSESDDEADAESEGQGKVDDG